MNQSLPEPVSTHLLTTLRHRERWTQKSLKRKFLSLSLRNNNEHELLTNLVVKMAGSYKVMELLLCSAQLAAVPTMKCMSQNGTSLSAWVGSGGASPWFGLTCPQSLSFFSIVIVHH